MIRLSDLLRRAGIVADRLLGEGPVNGVVSDSRKATPGCLFVCMPGHNSDSHAFLKDAKERGAVAALVRTEEACEQAWDLGLASILVRSDGPAFAEVVAKVCKVFFKNPSGRLRLIGVTGTNGKTTTAWMLRDALGALGRDAAYLGTLGYKTGEGTVTLDNTTPFSVELNQCLADAVEGGISDLAMEVSSHALEEKRVDGLEFDAAVFTNLTQDHLDYHGTMEAYGRAKYRLFSDLPKSSPKRFVAAIHIGDRTGMEWAPRLDVPVIRYGVGDGDLIGVPEHVDVDHIHMRLRYGGTESLCRLQLGGTFNVQNALSACAGLLAVGYGLEEASVALESAKPVPGRFEAVRNELGIGVLVDYAHTPDALMKLLDAAKALKPKRLITVFGCGGDRDRTKRPIMARVVSERSDLAVVTSDNPRTEDPNAILEEVQTGLVPGAESVAIVDRREAIYEAVRRANAGDIVVIAGKGHEDYQIIGRTKIPMDDRKMAREALEAKT